MQSAALKSQIPNLSPGGTGVRVTTLMASLVPAMSEFHTARLHIIDSHDFSGVMRKVKEEIEAWGGTVTEEYLQSGILALKQYYAIALLDPCNEHAVSDAIDPFWHAHILHTRAYAKFCDDVYGQFIHHEPLNRLDGEQVNRIAALYRHTVEVYSRVFSFVDYNFYPAKMPEASLVCKHYEVTNPPIREKALFEAVTRSL